MDTAPKEEIIGAQNLYQYDPTIVKYDPMAQPFSYFYVSISGQIEFGEFDDLDGL